MDPIRITIYENGLHPQAKLLYSILHAYAGADGVAVVPESRIADIMHISPARLRGYRSQLNGLGYCTIRLMDNQIVFRMASDHPARDIARSTRDSDHLAITPPALDVPTVPPTDHLARDSDRQVITAQLPTPPADRLARGSDRLARDIARSTRDGGDNRGGESERDLPTSSGKNSLTLSLFDAEQKKSVAILIDPAVGMSRFSAERLAAKYSFVDIRAFCCRWADEGRKSAAEAGLIAYRLEAAETVPPLSRNELWQRHRTPEELAAEEQERAESERLLAQWRAEAERQPAPIPPTPPNRERQRPEKTAADLWTAALAELAVTLPAPYKTWVRDTSALGHEDGEFVIGVPDAYAREWLNSRLCPQAQRILSRLVGRVVTVEFVVRPQEAG